MKILVDLDAIDAAYREHHDLVCDAELAVEQVWAEMASSALIADGGAT